MKGNDFNLSIMDKDLRLVEIYNDGCALFKHIRKLLYI